MCEQCEHKPLQDLHPYTVKLIRIVALQQAGYPLERDDLAPEEWEDLGRVKQALDRRDTNTKD